MSQSLPEEQLIKGYFLGDLTESEQDRVQERLFTDGDFFETLLIIEGELVDDYALGLLSDQDRAKLERRFLTSPQQHRKVSFVKTLEQYISDKQTTLTAKAYRASSLPRFTQFGSPFVHAEQPLANRRQDGDANRKELDGWEHLLREAQTNRNLVFSLMGDDWLGLQLLVRLRSASPAVRVDLFSGIESDEAELAAALSRLVQCGLVNETQGEFSCSWFGSEILQRLENISGLTLQSSANSI